jgi:SAM-dependent methyltransferase
MGSPASEARRRQNESEFHDAWAAGINPAETLVDETFTAVTAVDNQYILAEFGDVRGKRILDYGCGSAEGGVYLAKQGAEVVAVDVSPGMLAAANALARHHGVRIETRAVTSDAIPASNDEFDLIYGNGVLHHVNLDFAIPELARILKPTGKGCFIEPLPYNPIINVYRKLAHEVRTVDEKPLTFGDIARFESHFASVAHHEFWLTTLSVFLKFFLVDRVNPNKERYWKKIFTDSEKVASFFSPLKRLDERLLAAVPGLGRLCWETVLTIAQPRRG